MLTPHETRFRLHTADGAELAATAFEPIEPRGAVLLNSGTGIPQELYHPMARYLAERGYAVLSYDYRGIAGSRPQRLRGFEASVTHWGQHDAPAALEWLRQRHPGLPLHLVGHSMGSQIVGMMPNHDRLRQVIAIASSTGYWRNMTAPYRYFAAAMWFTFIPLTSLVFGYAPAKAVGQGEDLPKGVALDWRRWCMHPDYIRPDFGTRIRPVFYDAVALPFTAYLITDDPIANEVTVNDLLTLYPRADKTLIRVAPAKLGVAKIGHAGFFSRRFRENLWAGVAQRLDALS